MATIQSQRHWHDQTADLSVRRCPATRCGGVSSSPLTAHMMMEEGEQKEQEEAEERVCVCACVCMCISMT